MRKYFSIETSENTFVRVLLVMSIKGLGHEGTAVIEVIPCEQKFLSSMPFIIYEVARVVGQSRSFSWGLKQTNHASDKTRERLFRRGL